MNRLLIISVVLALAGPGPSPVGAQDPSQQFIGEATVNVIDVPVRVFDQCLITPCK